MKHGFAWICFQQVVIQSDETFKLLVVDDNQTVHILPDWRPAHARAYFPLKFMGPASAVVTFPFLSYMGVCQCVVVHQLSIGFHWLGV